MSEKKTIAELEEELESLRRKEAAREAQKSDIELANEIAAKFEDLQYFSRVNVLRMVAAMINTSGNLYISVDVRNNLCRSMPGECV